MRKLKVIDGTRGANTSPPDTTNKRLTDSHIGSTADQVSVGPENRSEYVRTLYNKYHRNLLQYLRRILPDGQEADEILHETYIRLLQQESLDKLEANARAYLFTVATNLVRDSLRKRSRQHQQNHISFNESQAEDNSPSVDEIASWEETITALKRVLLSLPPLTRDIFILHRFEQMTYPEISKALQIHTRTVERHMHNAIKRMQHVLGDLI